MFEIVILICALFFSAVGFSALLGSLWIVLLKPKKCKSGKLLVVLDGENDAGQINYYLEKYRWYGNAFANEIFFLYKGQTPSDSIALYQGISNVHFYSRSQLKELVEELGIQEV